MQLTVPEGDYFPNVGFVPGSPETIAVLHRFAPSRDEQKSLAVRLALAENYALTCIATGSLEHESLFRASLAPDLSEKAIRPSEVIGWAQQARFEAASKVINAYYFSMSADHADELHNDWRHTWEAIQAWVRRSPWREDFDFEIIPDPPSAGTCLLHSEPSRI